MLAHVCRSLWINTLFKSLYSKSELHSLAVLVVVTEAVNGPFPAQPSQIAQLLIAEFICLPSVPVSSLFLLCAVTLWPSQKCRHLIWRSNWCCKSARKCCGLLFPLKLLSHPRKACGSFESQVMVGGRNVKIGTFKVNLQNQLSGYIK